MNTIRNMFLMAALVVAGNAFAMNLNTSAKTISAKTISAETISAETTSAETIPAKTTSAEKTTSAKTGGYFAKVAAVPAAVCGAVLNVVDHKYNPCVKVQQGFVWLAETNSLTNGKVTSFLKSKYISRCMTAAVVLGAAYKLYQMNNASADEDQDADDLEDAFVDGQE